jgi:hypothetical protein
LLLYESLFLSTFIFLAICLPKLIELF